MVKPSGLNQGLQRTAFPKAAAERGVIQTREGRNWSWQM